MACGKNPASPASLGVTAPTPKPASHFKPSWIVWLVVGFLALMAVVLLARAPIASLLLVLSAVSVALAGPLGRYRPRLHMPAGKFGIIGLSVLSVVLFFGAAFAMPKTERPVSQTTGILPTPPPTVEVASARTAPTPATAPQVATAAPKPTTAPPTPVPPTPVSPTAAAPTSVPERSAVPAPTVDPRRARCGHRRRERGDGHGVRCCPFDLRHTCPNDHP